VFTAIGVAAALLASGGVVVGLNLFGGPSAAEITAAETRWGVSPNPDADVDYQSDVVILQNGALAIEELLDDGLTWRLKDDYPGVERIREDVVLFLTSRVAGRVAAIGRTEDGGIDVTLVPVDLPEIVRNGDFAWNEVISEEDFALRTDEFPGMLEETELDYDEDGAEEGTPTPVPESSDAPTTESDPLGLPAPEPVESRLASSIAAVTPTFATGATPVRSQTQPSPAPSPDPGNGWSTGVSDIAIDPWTIGVTGSSSELGFEATIAKGGLKGSMNAKLTFHDLNIQGSAQIRDGAWSGPPTVVITGIDGLELGFSAGSANGLLDNAKYQFDIPIEFSKQMLLGDIPVTLKAKFKFSVATGFSAKNATLSANGSYALAGELGIRDGEALVPSLTVVKPLIDTVSGVSLGIDSAIFAFNAKLNLGVGLAAVSIGPYGSITASVGLLRGSQLTAPWGVPCQATLVVKAGGGIGGSVPINFLLALQKRLGLNSPPKHEFTFYDKSAEIVNRTASLPMCANLLPTDSAPTETPPVEPRQTGNDPYTAAGAPNVPGPGNSESPRPDAPVTEAVENPQSPNSDLGDDGNPTGPEPGPKPVPGEDDYTVEWEFCDLQPDPVDPKPNLYGYPTQFYCADWVPPTPTPAPTEPPGDGEKI
jgi:hypothetical protein